MIVVMEETATEEQVSKVIEKIVELGFDIYRTTGARYTILGAVGSRPIEESDREVMESMAGVRDVVRISGPSVKKINRASDHPPKANPRIYFPHLTIFGVGLVGGSFALAARKAGLAGKITGCGERTYLENALSLNVIDGIDESFSECCESDADLIYLAAPVKAIIEFLKEKGSLLKAGAIVTDAGSAKREICEAARRYLPTTVTFIGGHPMAGSHKVGVEFASADLFKNAPYVLTADDSSPLTTEAGEKMKLVVEAVGGRKVALSPEDHDAMVARVSHAPQLISTALAAALEKSQDLRALQIAGGGFADMTRLARSRWSVWEDIIEANTDEISAALAEVIEELQRLREAVEKKNTIDLKKTFESVNDFLLES